MAYQVELVWNREFNFVSYGGPYPTPQEAVGLAKAMQESGDGARVKKTRVVDQDGKIVWAYGKYVQPLES